MPGLRSPFIPRARSTRAEVLDDPACAAALRTRSLADVARANRLLGGKRAVLAELAPLLRSHRGRTLTLLDVGTGIGDIPVAARRLAARQGTRLAAVGLDDAEPLAAVARERLGMAVRGDALHLPFATSSVDVVTCSQVLHHFREDAAVALLRELDRVARECVIVSDLRRSWIAAGGLWLVSFPMGFHPVSRADGMLSVLKGFTATELRDLVGAATGRPPRVTPRIGWRLTTSWRPA